jgi:hypothetical protein
MFTIACIATQAFAQTPHLNENSYVLVDAGSGFSITLNTLPLTANRVFQFPDAGGTLSTGNGLTLPFTATNATAGTLFNITDSHAAAPGDNAIKGSNSFGDYGALGSMDATSNATGVLGVSATLGNVGVLGEGTSGAWGVEALSGNTGYALYVYNFATGVTSGEGAIIKSLGTAAALEVQANGTGADITSTNWSIAHSATITTDKAGSRIVGVNASTPADANIVVGNGQYFNYNLTNFTANHNATVTDASAGRIIYVTVTNIPAFTLTVNPGGFVINANGTYSFISDGTNFNHVQ